MEVRTIIEKLSLQLLLEGKLNKAALQPHIDALRKLNLDRTGSDLVDHIAKQANDSTDSAKAALAYELALSLVDELSGHVSASTSTTEKGNTSRAPQGVIGETLSYDVSHGQEILSSFFSEIDGHLQVVEQQLMRLESHPTDKEALNAGFGAMHSLKGLTGFLDVKAAHELAHEAEAVMDLARMRETGIEPAECDAILRTIDVLRSIQDCILPHSRNPLQAMPAVPESCGSALAELQRLSNSSSPAAATPAMAASPEPIAATERKNVTQVTDASGLVRVKVQKLDALIELIGELVVTQTQVHEDADLHSLNSMRLSNNVSQMGKITRELQSVAMSLRMYPLRDVFGRVSRVARDIAHKQGKEIELLIDGEDTELDKNVIEALVDPLTHLVRNAVDHGIDLPKGRIASGKPARAALTISARHHNGSVQISVTDDGRGLNTARILAKARERGLVGSDENPTTARIYGFIFEPGFSTAEKVTEISGRGVGLDVVRRNAQALGGRVSVESVAGQSTSFILTLPLTLAIIDGLIVRTGTERFVVPIMSVIESIRARPEHISTVHGRGEMINVRGTILPLIRLSEFARVAPDFSEVHNAIAMIVECAGERYGLVVDELLGQQQIVIRGLGECLESIHGIASGAILGDGRVGLILDLEQVLRSARERTAALVN